MRIDGKIDKRTKAYRDSLKYQQEETKKVTVFDPPKKVVTIPKEAVVHMSSYTGKVRVDGLPDMRTKEAKEFVASQKSSGYSTSSNTYSGAASKSTSITSS